ncbi:general transcription factor IIF subunit 1-like [Cottoperca gobio]|uniref:Transcription initiation factor IIF subunit alpha n=1 Tax=Cottoperca gobio TaxID=56716 RepID=A0A6J2Q585_COTGO|nr:general transcription factor IIF subunit 1-like [Cottoperca gobio]
MENRVATIPESVQRIRLRDQIYVKHTTPKGQHPDKKHALGHKGTMTPPRRELDDPRVHREKGNHRDCEMLLSCVVLYVTDSSGESESSDDSDIDGETASALFMKKRTPPKRGGRGSAGSSRTGSCPGTPSIDPAATSNTLRAAASKLEQGKRPTPGPSTDSPAAKRLKMEPSSQSPVPSVKSTPQPPSGKSTPSSSDVQLTEEAVRRYLIRKPMTTKDLLKKFQTKRTGLSSEQTVNVLAQILKRLNPERKNVNDKMHFYLTE